MTTNTPAHKILIVDDERLNIEFLIAIIEAAAEQTGQNITVVSATSGAEALPMARSGNPDVILLDVRMPGMDGFEACQALKSEPATEQIPILFATAANREQEKARGLALGAAGYIAKPFDPDEVVSAVFSQLGLEAGDRAAPAPPAGTDAAGLFPNGMVGIDIEDGLMRTQGNAKLYHQLLIEFHKSKATAGAEIGAALASGDDEKLRRLAHGLKGVAGNIGATKLNQAAANMELAVKEGHRGDFGPLSAILLRNFDQVQNSLSRLEGRSSSAVSGQLGTVQNPEDLRNVRPLLDTLRTRLEQNDMGAEDMVQPIKDLLAGQEYADDMARLEVCVGKLDFAGALVSLETLTMLIKT